MGKLQKTSSDTPHISRESIAQKPFMNLSQSQLVELHNLIGSLLKLHEEFQQHLQDVLQPMGVAEGSGVDYQQALQTIENLFEQWVFSSSDISDTAKLQLAKLQAAYQRVAVKDAQFLQQADHPARVVLKQLAEMAKDSSQAATLLYAVDGIIKKHTTDPTVFISLQEELKKKSKSPSSPIEKHRKQQADKGKDVDAMVKAFVQSTLQSGSCQDLSHDLKAFIRGPWQAYMYWVAIHEGVQGDCWEQAKQTLIQLIRACDPSKEWSSQKREDILDQVSAQIDNGFDALKTPSTERSEWMVKILREFELCTNLSGQDDSSQADSSSQESDSSGNGFEVQQEKYPLTPATPNAPADQELEEIELTAPSPFTNKN